MKGIRIVALFVFLALFPARAAAGLYYSAEQYAELPSRFRGFLFDQRALRVAGIERPRDVPLTPLREEFLTALERLESFAKARPLNADEAADLGAVHVRLGKLDKALAVLQPAARKWPEHFHLAANLGTAYQLSGDLERAAASLEEAVRLAPPKFQSAEQYHLKLVRLRLKEGRAANAPAAPDDLFGVKYVGASNTPEAGAIAEVERKKLPTNAVAVVEQLALWLPGDARLLWQLGELANACGDVPTAAAILDGCVTEFALASPELRKRRQLYRAAAQELMKKPDHDQHAVVFRGKSSRPLLRAFDEGSLPPIRADRVNPLPWPVLAATTMDARGRPVFLKHLVELDGKTVALNGFMQSLEDGLALHSFLLLEYPVGCWFCETPEPTGLVNIEMKSGTSVELRKGLVKVTGTLVLNRANPETYYFTLTDARVGGAD